MSIIARFSGMDNEMVEWWNAPGQILHANELALELD